VELHGEKLVNLCVKESRVLMAPSNVKMEVPESPMREGDTPSSTESEAESNVLPKNTLALARKAAGTPASSVHELLECPVCTNSMYPPIHQVCDYNGDMPC
jgi:hypothetical protein